MLISFGDALIDFIPAKTADGRSSYIPAAGGSCLNIAVTMSRLGARAGFMGGVSNDLFGDVLMDALKASNVDTSYVALSDRETTLAFVSLGGDEPQYAFYDEVTAGRLWKRSDSPAFSQEVKLVHVGSVPLINGPVADEALAMLKAEKGKRLLCIDPNCRPTLVKDIAAYRARIAEMVKLCEIIKLSAADLEYLDPTLTLESAAAQWLAEGAKLVIITRGSRGAIGFFKGGSAEVPVRKVNLVDTIGAGDTFIGALLVRLEELDALSFAGLDALTGETLTEAMSFAAAAASITCSREGANPPWRHEMV